MAEATDPKIEASPPTAAAPSGAPPKAATPPKSTPPPVPLHPLIDKLASHPDHPQGTVALEGYTKPASKPGFHRLYFHHNLRAYVEIPEGSIVHHAPVDPSNPIGRTRVFVTESAKLEVVQEMDASFLQGSIAEAHPVDRPVITCETLAAATGFITTFTHIHHDLGG